MQDGLWEQHNLSQHNYYVVATFHWKKTDMLIVFLINQQLMPTSPDEDANTEVHIAKISSEPMIPGENSTQK